MISIIICSINDILFKEVSISIKETIGDVQFEIIRIDNNIDQLSIFEAYNKGGSLAKYHHLIFLHEDVLFKSNDWGSSLIDCFKDEKLGLLGLVGTKYKSKVPSGWYIDKSTHYGHLFYNINGEESKLEYKKTSNFEEVVLVDGLFMATTKDVFGDCKFDDLNYSGFHFYDADFSTQVKTKGYKVLLTNQISLIHKSQGNVNSSYYHNMMIYDEKWTKELPLSVVSSPKNKINIKLEWSSFIRFTRLVFKFEKSKSLALKKINSYKPKKMTLLIVKYWVILLVELIKKKDE
jgi:GT2 family glycosyltransferase